MLGRTTINEGVIFRNPPGDALPFTAAVKVYRGGGAREPHPPSLPPSLFRRTRTRPNRAEWAPVTGGFAAAAEPAAPTAGGIEIKTQWKKTSRTRRAEQIKSLAASGRSRRRAAPARHREVARHHQGRIFIPRILIPPERRED